MNTNRQLSKKHTLFCQNLVPARPCLSEATFGGPGMLWGCSWDAPRMRLVCSRPPPGRLNLNMRNLDFLRTLKNKKKNLVF